MAFTNGIEIIKKFKPLLMTNVNIKLAKLI